MRIIKKSCLKYLFVILFIISIFSLMVIQVKGEESVNPIMYDFNTDTILDVDKEDNPEYYNIKEQEQYNDNYLAWKSFDKPLEFDNDIVYSNDVQISNFNGHENVINVSYVDSPSKYYINFEKKSFINISFWFCTTNVTIRQHYFLANSSINDNNNFLCYYYILGSVFSINLGGGSLPLGIIENNVWYHTSLLINCSNDVIDVWFNYKLIYQNKSFLGFKDMDFVNYFRFGSYNPHSSVFSNYLDALDHSYSQDWNFYRSRIPELEVLNELQVDKYEFDYDINDFENDFYVWKEFGYLANYGDTYIQSTDNINNEIILNSSYGQVNSNGICYSDINSSSMIINISLDLEILLDYDHYTFKHLITIYEMSNISSFFTYIDFSMSSNYVRIYDTNLDASNDWFEFVDNHEYLIDVYINYYDNIVVFTAFDLETSVNYMYNCSFSNTYHFQECYGLYKIEIYNYCAEVFNPSYLRVSYYSIGIYESGISFIKENNTYEFGLMSYQIDNNWNSDNHNLLTIDSENYYDLFVHNYYEYYLDGYKIRDIENQTSIKIINLADNIDNNNAKFVYNNPYLIFRLYGNLTNFYEIEISGIQLIDDNNNYVYGNYYYNNTDSDYNWFKCIDNKLYYNFNNNDTIGIMRISFNVNDILLTNESIISYSSFITNNYSGYINLTSYYSTQSFEISNNDTLVYTYNNITQTEIRTITTIIIEIQSNSSSSGIANGYIQNINIYPDKSLFPEFEPIDYLESTFLEKLIETIIPLLFFIFPSLALRTKFGNKSVIPFWILLTIIFLFTNFIPFWICFTIFLAIGLMVLHKEEVLE